MIRSSKCKETEKVFNRQYSRTFPTDIQKRALRNLRMISRAADIKDLRVPPGHRLEAQKDGRAGQHSICINDRRRVTADTALRLAKFFNMTPPFWLGLQMDYDLDVEEDQHADRVEQEVQVYSQHLD